MGQAGTQDPNDPYDARNPGVRPYKGRTDSEVEAEEAGRRKRDLRLNRNALIRAGRQSKRGRRRG